MPRRAITLLFLFFALSASAQLIPDTRRINWTPGMMWPIPNFPNQINVKNAPYNAVGNGVTDDCDAILAAVAACPNGGAVYFPVGTYMCIRTNITLQNKSIVLRGDGPTLSQIVFAETNVTLTALGSITIRGASSTSVNITGDGGQQKGSTNITLSSTSAFSVGDTIVIRQNNDTNTLEGNISGGETTFSQFYQQQYNVVAGKDSTHLFLKRPLHCTYDSSGNLTSRVQRIVATTNCGFESLGFLQHGHRDGTLFFFQAANCWVTNCVITNSNWYDISCNNALAIEARINVLHHAQTYGQGGYGVNLTQSTDCWIEDNIIYYKRHAVIIQNASSGNCITYNTTESMFDAFWPDTDFLMPDIEFHGGQPTMNLVQGNSIGCKTQADDFWGSNGPNTWYGNLVRRDHLLYGASIDTEIWAFANQALALSNNVIANVWGLPGQTGYSTNHMGGTSQTGGAANPYDPRVLGTILYHGNISHVGGTSTNWDPTISDHTLPASILETDVPSWWGNLSYPPYGPNALGVTNPIPSWCRMNGLSYPYVTSVASVRQKVGLRRFGF